MRHSLRTLLAVCAMCASAAAPAAGQEPQLVFTVAAPESAPAADTHVRASAVVAERGLALWGGSSSDFGLGVDVAARGWMVSSIESVGLLPLGSNQRPNFQQLEVVHPLFSNASSSIAAGGGVREEWDGTRVRIARGLARSDVAGGRLQGSFVIERALSSSIQRDAADVITTVGWSRLIRRWLTAGVEGIGQDLEGFWDPAEAEGGARLLVGPSVRVQSNDGRWTATVSVGPVLRTKSTIAAGPDGHHFGIFAAASWLPVRH
jgi:hypothetical protein